MSTLKTIFIFCRKTYFKMYKGTNMLLDKHTTTLQLKIQTDQVTLLLQNSEGFWLRFKKHIYKKVAVTTFCMYVLHFLVHIWSSVYACMHAAFLRFERVADGMIPASCQNCRLEKPTLSEIIAKKPQLFKNRFSSQTSHSKILGGV